MTTGDNAPPEWFVRSQKIIDQLYASLIVPTCDARNRSGGYCKLRPIFGKARCRFHGGLSTGPRTEGGKKRIAEATRERMLRYWRARKERHNEGNA